MRTREVQRDFKEVSAACAGYFLALRRFHRIWMSRLNTFFADKPRIAHGG